MMCSPENYIGKTIRMSGQFSIYVDEETNNCYYSCVISDATACCSQGIEFTLDNNDYPAEGDDICVQGIFETYTEDDNIYCTLRNAFLL
ncbi:MAG: hypothetical protein K6G26_04855 [Lachnospiraceae bacterium]|nr:hypothetical protein [Lachnospiraceae bacterium]